MENKYKRPQGSLISFMSNMVKQHGGINFAQGIPGFMPDKALLNTLKELPQLSVHQYAPGLGNLRLRNLLLEKYKNYNFAEEQLLITQGATEALTLITTYLKNTIGKEFSAMAFDPVYESYRHIPRIMNIPFHAYIGDFEIDTIEAFILEHNVKIIYISSPGNPLGYIYSQKEISDLRKLCENRDVYLIIDAVYSDFWFDQPVYYPIENLSKNVFYINSFSKSLSITGWRIGYFFAHAAHSEALRDIHDYIGLCVNAPLQEALAMYLEQNNFGQEYIENTRKVLMNNYNAMSKHLQTFGLKVENAKGGYYIWAQLPKNNDGFQFTMKLYDKSKVAVIPGIHFSDKAISHIRLNIARPTNEIDEGIKQIEMYFSNLL